MYESHSIEPSHCSLNCCWDLCPACINMYKLTLHSNGPMSWVFFKFITDSAAVCSDRSDTLLLPNVTFIYIGTDTTVRAISWRRAGQSQPVQTLSVKLIPGRGTCIDGVLTQRSPVPWTQVHQIKPVFSDNSSKTVHTGHYHKMVTSSGHVFAALMLWKGQ
jgi:hypothetical protein